MISGRPPGQGETRPDRENGSPVPSFTAMRQDERPEIVTGGKGD
jgi:hypothetical protein